LKKTNVRKNALANYVSQFYTMFIGIFMLPFYLEYLGAEAYGLVGFFTMLQSLLMLLDLGLSGTLSRETANLKDKKNGLIKLKQLIKSIEYFYGFIVVFVIVIIYLSSNWLSNNWLDIQSLDLDTVSYCIQLMGIMIAFRWFVSLYRGSIIGFENQVWLSFYNIFIATLKFVGAFILIKFYSNNILDFFIYQLIVAFLEFLIIKNKLYTFLPTIKGIKPSIGSLKEIAPFALSLAYTSTIWIISTQLDKLILSHYITLEEYGYFTLVVILSSMIMQLSGPLSQAILPRLTSLYSNNKEDELIKLYHNSTQFISIFIFSIVGMIAYFSYELLYAWTGNIEASKWASPVLFWYVISNGILALGAFQYYLQFAFGNLKYHVKMNTIAPFIYLPIVFFAVRNYGAIGAAIAWFWIQLITFIFWTYFVHNKFVPNLHKKWIIEDILPSLLMTLFFFFVINFFNFDFKSFNRLEIFLLLILIGLFLLFLNSIVYSNIRKIIKVNFFNRNLNVQ